MENGTGTENGMGMEKGARTVGNGTGTEREQCANYSQVYLRRNCKINMIYNILAYLYFKIGIKTRKDTNIEILKRLI